MSGVKLAMITSASFKGSLVAGDERVVEAAGGGHPEYTLRILA